MKKIAAFLLLTSIVACKKNTNPCQFAFDRTAIFASQNRDSLYIGTNQKDVDAGQGTQYIAYYNFGDNIPRPIIVSSIHFYIDHPYRISKDSLSASRYNMDSVHPFNSNLKIDSLTLKDVYFLDHNECLDNAMDTAILHFTF